MKTRTKYIIGGIIIISVAAILTKKYWMTKTLTLKQDKAQDLGGDASAMDKVGTAYTLLSDYTAISRDSKKSADTTFKKGQTFVKTNGMNATQLNMQDAVFLQPKPFNSAVEFVIPTSIIKKQS